MPKKRNILAEYQSTKGSVSTLPERLQTTEFMVPAIVRAMGNLAAAPAVNLVNEGDEKSLQGLVEESYKELGDLSATLLDHFQIHTIPEETVASVTHRLASLVDPLVSLHSRVDHLYRSYRQAEGEHLLDDVQKLWAALEHRAPSVLGGVLLEDLLFDDER